MSEGLIGWDRLDCLWVDGRIQCGLEKSHNGGEQNEVKKVTTLLRIKPFGKVPQNHF